MSYRPAGTSSPNPSHSMTRLWHVAAIPEPIIHRTTDHTCTCGHGVYGHGYFEGSARDGNEEWVFGCTDCSCRKFDEQRNH